MSNLRLTQRTGKRFVTAQEIASQWRPTRVIRCVVQALEPKQAGLPRLSPEVVERLRGGDTAAFAVVYEALRARIYTFLLRMTGNAQAAEDLSQETWLRLATHARRLAADTELPAFLYTVARNLARSRRRWAILDQTRLRELFFAQPMPAPATPFALAHVGELARRTEVALAQLPPGLREVVLLCAVDGFSNEEAARMLALTPEALRKRLSRGRALLREQLGGAIAEGEP